MIMVSSYVHLILRALYTLFCPQISARFSFPQPSRVKGKASHSKLVLSHFLDEGTGRGVWNPRLVIDGGYDPPVEETMMHDDPSRIN